MTAWWPRIVFCVLIINCVYSQQQQQQVRSSSLKCCGCWNSTEDGSELEIECHCTGQEILSVPTDLDKSVQRLTIAEAGLAVLKADSFKPYSNSLRDIVLTELPSLRSIEVGTFADLPYLRTIFISRAESLQVLPPGVFSGTSGKLNTLRIMHTGLLHIPELSPFSKGAIMNMIDLVGNNIRSVHSHAFQVKADELLLDYNDIEFVEGWAFNGSEIAKLSLKGNKALSKLSLYAFYGLRSLRELDLSETAITQLPTGGLEELEILRIQDTASLKEIPSVYSFKQLQEAWLTYSFHCCAFKFPAQHDPERHTLQQAYLAKVHELCAGSESAITTPQVPDVDNYEETGFWHTLRRKRELLVDSIWGDEGIWGSVPSESDWEQTATILPPSVIHDDMFQHESGRGGFIENVETNGDVKKNNITARTFEISKSKLPEIFATQTPEEDGVFHQTTAAVPPQQVQAICGNLSRSPAHHNIRCYPEPDAFNPCEDIMGTTWLRVAVWFVVVTSVLGNLAVIIVLANSKISRMTVPKFLMCNLAFADLCMGTYLMLIAAMDIHSIGVYFNYAHDWQSGLGCKIAGFITVFASQLSVFTLSLLTLERWMAITYAMYLNKRLNLKMASHAMVFGWAYAILMAALPLFGISGYSKTSICLPMETSDVADMTYLIFLLVINGLAFIVILVCYIQIYSSLDQDTRRGVASALVGTPGMGAASGEMNIAKKMALLVFTDLTCWAPIAFFGLTAVAGYPLIDVTRSKILLVFFYPLNSCANPFLYTILTSQYRRDSVLLLSKYGLCKGKAQKYKRERIISNGGNQNRTSSILHAVSTFDKECRSGVDHNKQSTSTMANRSDDITSETSSILKTCLILQHGSNCTLCVIKNQQETFL